MSRRHLPGIAMCHRQIWACLLVFSTVPLAAAECLDAPPTETDIVVESCRTIEPGEVKALDPDGSQSSDEFYASYYRGALVTTPSNAQYVYPSDAKDPCASFAAGDIVKKIVGCTCCDTGSWGKCLYGGCWLWDVSGSPVNTFQ